MGGADGLGRSELTIEAFTGHVACTGLAGWPPVLPRTDGKQAGHGLTVCRRGSGPPSPIAQVTIAVEASTRWSTRCDGAEAARDDSQFRQVCHPLVGRCPPLDEIAAGRCQERAFETV